MNKTTFAIMMALLTGSVGIYADAVDDFSSGEISGGSGWTTDWTFGDNGDVGSGLIEWSASTNPLDGNGNYANIIGTGTNNTTTAGIHRDYTAGLDALTEEHTISFLLRIDSLNAEASGDASRAAVIHGGTSYGLSSTTSWALYVQDGTFRYFNGDGGGAFGGAQTDSGIAVTTGTVYSVRVTNRNGADTVGTPSTGGEWDLLITAGGSTILDLPNLEYRRTTAPAAGHIGMGVAGPNTTSFDEVLITAKPQVPDELEEIGSITIENIPEGLTLTWNSAAGQKYELQDKADLTDTWNTYSNLVGGADSTMTVTTSTDDAVTFYRVISYF